MNTEIPHQLIADAFFQVGSLTVLLVALGALAIFRWRWLVEYFQIGSALVYGALMLIRALAFAYGTYLVLAFLLNVVEMTSWERLAALLTADFDNSWVSGWTGVASLAGLFVGFYTWGGGFSYSTG